MPPIIQRFGPPAAVFGIALYLGWPAPKPLDLGETVVKAKSVRWKKDDIDPPKPLATIVDPFRPVLVADETMEVEPETGKLVVATKPAGPDPLEIKSGLQLSGIANLSGKSWAIINGKPRLIGDQVQCDASERHMCKVISIASDHVVLRCKETEVMIRPNPFETQSQKPAAMPNSAATQELATPSRPLPPDEMKPPAA